MNLTVHLAKPNTRSLKSSCGGETLVKKFNHTHIILYLFNVIKCEVKWYGEGIKELEIRDEAWQSIMKDKILYNCKAKRLFLKQPDYF